MEHEQNINRYLIESFKTNLLVLNKVTRILYAYDLVFIDDLELPLKSIFFNTLSNSNILEPYDIEYVIREFISYSIKSMLDKSYYQDHYYRKRPDEYVETFLYELLMYKKINITYSLTIEEEYRLESLLTNLFETIWEILYEFQTLIFIDRMYMEHGIYLENITNTFDLTYLHIDRIYCNYYIVLEQYNSNKGD